MSLGLGPLVSACMTVIYRHHSEDLVPMMRLADKSPYTILQTMPAPRLYVPGCVSLATRYQTYVSLCSGRFLAQTILK